MSPGCRDVRTTCSGYVERNEDKIAARRNCGKYCCQYESKQTTWMTVLCESAWFQEKERCCEFKYKFWHQAALQILWNSCVSLVWALTTCYTFAHNIARMLAIRRTTIRSWNLEKKWPIHYLYSPMKPVMPTLIVAEGLDVWFYHGQSSVTNAGSFLIDAIVCLTSKDHCISKNWSQSNKNIPADEQHPLKLPCSWPWGTLDPQWFVQMWWRTDFP